MNRSKEIRKKIFETADSLRKQGVYPTTLNIREKLGGSQTTVSKYLRQWRELYDCEEGFSPKKMQQKLEELMKINDNVTSELLHKAEDLAMEKSKNEKLTDENIELRSHLAESRAMVEKIMATFINTESILKESFNFGIAMLTEQVAKINERAVQKIQEVGHSYDENIMKAKLEIRELQAQIKLREM